MSATHNLKTKWARKRLDKAMDRSFEAMEPYMNIIESENGMLAMAMVSSIATGSGNAKALEVVVQKASLMTNIPPEVFHLYAKSTIAMIECFKLEG